MAGRTPLLQYSVRPWRRQAATEMHAGMGRLCPVDCYQNAASWLWPVGQSLPATASDAVVVFAENTFAPQQHDSGCGLWTGVNPWTIY